MGKTGKHTVNVCTYHGVKWEWEIQTYHCDKIKYLCAFGYGVSWLKFSVEIDDDGALNFMNFMGCWYEGIGNSAWNYQIWVSWGKFAACKYSKLVDSTQFWTQNHIKMIKGKSFPKKSTIPNHTPDNAV